MGSTTIPTDNITITFSEPGTYLRALNYATTETGVYSISLEKTIYSEQKMSVINFSPFAAAKYFMVVSQNGKTLVLSDNFYDGYTYTYTRRE